MPSFFFFNDTATTEIYTLSLHDALPICMQRGPELLTIRFTQRPLFRFVDDTVQFFDVDIEDRKSTRLNSSHLVISYAVFCLKKKIVQNIEGVVDLITVPAAAAPNDDEVL